MQELDDWARLGVEGHSMRSTRGTRRRGTPRPDVAAGRCKETEVVAMNSLTVNLHLLMVSFYRPRADRFRILMEDSAFPSDSYAIRSQADFHARASNGAFNVRDAVGAAAR